MSTYLGGQPTTIRRRVYFTGSTALEQGQAVCFDRDYGNTASLDWRRDTYVELPNTTNCRWFAGIVARDYPANSNGQPIEIFLPGSVCRIPVLADATAGSTVVTFSLDDTSSALWIEGGISGRGSALCLQTIKTYKVYGAGTYTTSGGTTTLSYTGIGSLVSEGDTLNILAPTPSRHTIASVSTNSVTITPTLEGSSVPVIFYVPSSNFGYVEVLLLDGDEVGGLKQYTANATVTNEGVSVAIAGKTIALGTSSAIGAKKLVRNISASGNVTIDTDSIVTPVTVNKSGATYSCVITSGANAYGQFLALGGGKYTAIGGTSMTYTVTIS